MKTSVLGYSVGAGLGGIVIIGVGLYLQSGFYSAFGFTVLLLAATVFSGCLVGHANLNKNKLPTWVLAGMTVSVAGLDLVLGFEVARQWVVVIPNHAVAAIVSFIAVMMVACTIGASVKIPARAENADSG